jgi:hypothetical protein
MHLKNNRSTENGAYAWIGTTVGSKLHFDQMTAPVPEIMVDSLYGLKIVLCSTELQYKTFSGRTYIYCRVYTYFPFIESGFNISALGHLTQFYFWQ